MGCAIAKSKRAADGSGRERGESVDSSPSQSSPAQSTATTSTTQSPLRVLPSRQAPRPTKSRQPSTEKSIIPEKSTGSRFAPPKKVLVESQPRWTPKKLHESQSASPPKNIVAEQTSVKPTGRGASPPEKIRLDVISKKPSEGQGQQPARKEASRPESKSKSVSASNVATPTRKRGQTNIQMQTTRANLEKHTAAARAANLQSARARMNELFEQKDKKKPAKKT